MPFAFVGLLRLVLFVTVVVAFPAFIIGTISNRILAALTRLPIRSRVLLSAFAGMAYVYTIPVVAAYALESDELGFLVTSGFVLVSAVSFIIIGFCTPRMAPRHRLVVACALSVPVLWGSHIASPDGLAGEVCSATLGDHTEYAAAYSASGFRRIRVGMSAEQVRQLLGKPLDQWTPDGSDDLYWRWTRSRDGSHYYRYRVVIFRAGRVGDKSAYAYCDPMD